MLKNKLITFFKNPIVKDIFIVLTAMIIVASIISLPVSNAGAQVNVAFRAAPMGVSVGTKDIQMPELAPGQNDLTTKSKKYTNVFCIDEGTQLSYETYQTEYNAYNASESSKYFKNYNSALWLIDNMYVSTSSTKDVSLNYLANLVTSPDVAKNVTNYGTVKAEDIKALNKTVGNGSDTSGNKINRNLIEIIEQLVLWNYTKNTGTTLNSDALVNNGFSGSNITSADQNACKYLYYGLKYLANKNSNYSSNGTVNNVVSLDSAKAVIDINKGQVGPYYLKANGVILNIDNTLLSKITANVTKLDNTTQELGNDKIIINKDGSFYINIKDCGNVSSAQLKIGAIYSGTKTTCELLVNQKTQNIINIRKTANTKELSDSKSISYSGKYTVKLIKTNADGTTAIQNNPAIFTVSGAASKNNEKTENNGILTIVTDKVIESVSSTDTYKIVENEAPQGFEKYNGEINLTVKFKLNGSSFIVDKENTTLKGTSDQGTVKLNIVNDNIIEVYVPNIPTKKEEPKKEFDLSLRKFITKIDNKNVDISRVPVIDAESKTVLEKYNTAVYHHTKQSLIVKEGSLVEYTIRVYNEGEIAGFAKEITDYLPEGLKFIKIADESANLYKTDATSDSKKIIIKYNGNDTILPDSITRILNKETNKIYQEVKLICEVQKGATGYITSRAEITNYGYYDEENVWHEAKAIKDSDIDSVQNTISNSLKLDTWYEDAKIYTYVNSEGKTVNVKDYYPGVQDDDDFETVQVIKTGLYNVVIRKVDSSNKNQGLAGAYFTVSSQVSQNNEHTGSKKKYGPTNESGYLDIVREEPILSSNTITVYTIKEETAPKGYEKYNKEIKLTVATMQSNNGYVLDEKNTKIEDNDRVTINVNASTSTITLTIPNDKKEFDFSLRKFITNINDTAVTTREPKVILSDDFKSGKVTTATYNHPKDALNVATNDIVTYKLRVYNEAKLSGYALKVMDDIADGLEFLPENTINIKYGWKMYKETNTVSENTLEFDGKKYVSTENAKEADIVVTEYLKDSLIKGYDQSTMSTLDYKDVELAFKVIEPSTSDKIITNYAQIVDDADENKQDVTDRDSLPNKWNEGEDDQDIENIKLRYFDFSLRKFITNVNNTPVTSRAPEVVLTEDFKAGKVTDATYNHPKDAVDVHSKDIVTYTLRVYNEAELSGYALKVIDDIPEGLQYLPENPTNIKYGWKMYKETDKISVDSIVFDKKIYVPTENREEANVVVTEYLKDELIKGYDKATMTTLDYKDVELAFEVIESAEPNKVITNYAQIVDDADENKKEVVDRDSTPNEWNEGEDDQDIEKIKLRYFDLSLRKFITNLNNTPVTSRAPEVVLTEDFKAGKVTDPIYNHPKDPLDVYTEDIVTYTLRVYNEAELSGYALKVIDDIPTGLQYLPDNAINIKYGWKMYKETDKTSTDSITFNKKLYVPTENVKEADVVVTEYLKDSLIKGYNQSTMSTLDYKDVELAFKVIEPAKSDRIIINYAQIVDDADENKKDVTDRDSTPNEWNEGDDDQDIEKIKLRYHDLSLRKWVTEVIVTENGKTQIIKTGHKAEDEPEDIVKVDLKKSKINDVTVKFRYSFRVTNQGEIAGAALELSEYIPDGLKFIPEENPGWKEVEGKFVTESLSNVILEPGESTEVSVLLTWINGANNMGIKTNVAEISKDYNEHGTPDIDSTPNNKKEGKEDIDDASVMITIKTGSEAIFYATLGLGFVVIIGLGAFEIKKKII